ncbi:MAG: hypothetical protein HW411_797 [Gammaproteobacteria bacterium]|nr:hypothetical protein [Gammaproteobacteria bacterium]
MGPGHSMITKNKNTPLSLGSVFSLWEIYPGMVIPGSIADRL